MPNYDADVIQQGADTVFVEFGMNDAIARPGQSQAVTLAQFTANLNTIITGIKAGLPNAEILLLTMNPARDTTESPTAGTYRPNLALYYQAVREVAAAQSLQVIDTYPLWLKLQKSSPIQLASYLPDGVHPVVAGIQAITTPAVIAALTEPFQVGVPTTDVNGVRHIPVISSY